MDVNQPTFLIGRMSVLLRLYPFWLYPFSSSDELVVTRWLYIYYLLSYELAVANLQLPPSADFWSPLRGARVWEEEQTGNPARWQ